MPISNVFGEFDSDIVSALSSLSGVLSQLCPAAGIINQIFQQYEKVRHNKKQCKAICERSLRIVVAIDSYLKGSEPSSNLVTSWIKLLVKSLNEVNEMMKKLSSLNFFRSLLRQQSIADSISDAHRSLGDALGTFGASSNLVIADQQERFEQARRRDTEDLRNRIAALELTEKSILTEFEIPRDQIEDAMLAMRKEVASGRDSIATEYLRKGLKTLEKSNPRKPHMETPLDFTITSYDIDFGESYPIGKGSFGEVRRASCILRSQVAVKIFDPNTPKKQEYYLTKAEKSGNSSHGLKPKASIHQQTGVHNIGPHMAHVVAMVIWPRFRE